MTWSLTLHILVMITVKGMEDHGRQQMPTTCAATASEVTTLWRDRNVCIIIIIN